MAANPYHANNPHPCGGVRHEPRGDAPRAQSHRGLHQDQRLQRREWLLDRLVRHYSNPHDVRDLLRAFAQLSGEINTTHAGVVVTLDPPDTPIHRRALQGLVDDLNAADSLFPGTDVSVTYRVAVHRAA